MDVSKFVKQKLLDVKDAEENLKKAALEYARAKQAAGKSKKSEPPIRRPV
jgi:hypothetical protein